MIIYQVRFKKILILCVPLFLWFNLLQAQENFPFSCRKSVKPSIELKTEVIADGLRHPWGLAFLPGGVLAVTERAGRLRIIKNKKVSAPLTGVPEVYAQGQGGLLDVVTDPEFEKNQTLYLTFSEEHRGLAGTAVFKARLEKNGEIYRLTGGKVIFSVAKKSAGGLHFGSRLAFRKDNTLFVTLGERGDSKRAQDPFDHAGSVIRINRDGSVPKDNPFVSGEKGLPEIWSIGHRNPQGAFIRPDTGELYTLAHGAKGGDEINVVRAGKNYGWPVISYGVHYIGTKIGIGNRASGFEQPLYYWDPSIAPSGFAFYDPLQPQIPAWRGSILVGALKYKMLVRLSIKNQCIFEERYLQGKFGRIRDVRTGPNGAVWLLTDENDGKIIRVTQK